MPLSEWLRQWYSGNLQVVVTHEKHMGFILESSFPDCYSQYQTLQENSQVKSTTWSTAAVYTVQL